MNANAWKLALLIFVAIIVVQMCIGLVDHHGAAAHAHAELVRSFGTRGVR
jgi:hypothetical protein